MQLNVESVIVSVTELEYVFTYLKKYYEKKNKDGNKRGHEMFSKLKDEKYEYFLKIGDYLFLNLFELENMQNYIITVYKCEDEKAAVSSKEYMYYYNFMKGITTGLDYLRVLKNEINKGTIGRF